VNYCINRANYINYGVKISNYYKNSVNYLYSGVNYMKNGDVFIGISVLFGQESFFPSFLMLQG
jgi:hypothetical protein